MVVFSSCCAEDETVQQTHGRAAGMRRTRGLRLGVAIGAAIAMSGLAIGMALGSIPGAGNVIEGCYPPGCGLRVRPALLCVPSDEPFTLTIDGAAMRTPRLALAVLLTLVGAVWIGQGTGIVGGSAMSGSPFWAVAGLALIVVAVVMVGLERRRPAR
jgi:hypothetical protein